MNNFTPRLEKILKLGRKEAQRIGNAFLEAEHVIIALTNTESGTAVSILKNTQIPMEKVREALNLKLVEIKNPDVIPPDKSALTFSADLERILERSKALAKQSSDEFVGTEHFLVAVLESEIHLTTKCFKDLGIDVQGMIKSLMDEIMPKDGEEKPSRVTAGGVRSNSTKDGESVLKKFSINLTEKARKSELDPVIGRSDEIGRVCRILARKKKNNPILVGPAGVGKTSIAEGLALRIHEKTVPNALLTKEVFALDLTQVVAGTMYRGEFEERLKKIMAEVKAHPNYIVFIDEIHMLIGAGSSEGMDASNILKPALARGEFHCIGATTVDEYKRYIERDSALERRFQSVRVNEPSIEDTIKILKGARKTYKDFHHVDYSDEVIEQIVTLSSRYITSRNQPDKSFDIMDEIGASRKLTLLTNPEEKEALTKELATIQHAKAEALVKTDMDEHTRIKKEEATLQHKLNKLVAEEEKTLDATIEDVYAVIAAWTGIPVGNLTSLQKNKLIQLADELNGVVIGQPVAVKEVANVIKKSRTVLKNPNRPIGSFLFVGPTGVGKSLLAETVATKIFGSEEAFLRLDMSEYIDGMSVNKLIGSPPGYVGYNEGGLLSKFVQSKPYSLVLFDELEKAHPDVVLLLLQILENGIIKDSFGKEVNFKNTIIICTSNAGATSAKSMGFNTQANSIKIANEHLVEEVKRIFKPEFLNRLVTVVFTGLNGEDAKKIIDLEIGKVNERLQEHPATIVCTEEAKKFLITNGFDEKKGGRNVRSQVEVLVENKLVDDFLADKIPVNGVITFDVIDGKLTHTIGKAT